MFSLQNALVLARLSKFSYRSPSKAIEGATRVLGFKKARFISKQDTQVLIAKNSTMIVVAFRGTEVENLEDWLTSFETSFLKTPLGQVHRGIYEALQIAWPSVHQTLRSFRNSAQKIWFTGHSLGGGLAVLAASKYAKEPEKVGGLYTYGQLRVGDGVFAKNFDRALKNKTFRFVNNNDIVPRLPPRAMGYADLGQTRYFDMFGRMFTDPETWRLFLDSMAGIADKALERYDELNHFTLDHILMDWVGDHSIDRYISNIRKNIEKKGTGV